MEEFEDLRQHKRFPIRTKVQVTLAGVAPFVTTTLDFSDGGLFILGKPLANLPRGTKLSVQSAEGIEDPPVLQALVAWSNHRGAGIQYLL